MIVGRIDGFLIILLLCLIASGVVTMKKGKKICKFPKHPNITLEVVDFVSIVSFKMAKCTPFRGNYTIETCGLLENCKKPGRWISYECNNTNPDPKGRYITCKVNIYPSSGSGTLMRVCVKPNIESARKNKTRIRCKKFGDIPDSITRLSTFTAPKIINESVGKRKIDFSIKVPAEKYLCRMQTMTYFIKMIKLKDKRQQCPGLCETKMCESKEITASWDDGVNCSVDNHALKTRALTELDPGTTYCVYASYATKPTSNANGPSKVAVKKITTEEDPIYESSYFVPALVGGVVVVFLVGVGTKLAHGEYKKIEKENSYQIKLIQEVLDAKHDLVSGSDSSRSQVHRLDEDERQILESMKSAPPNEGRRCAIETQQVSTSYQENNNMNGSSGSSGYMQRSSGLSSVTSDPSYVRKECDESDCGQINQTFYSEIAVDESYTPLITTHAATGYMAK